MLAVLAEVTVVVVASLPSPDVSVMGLVKFGARPPVLECGTEVVLKMAGGGFRLEVDMVND